jgi:predicted transposase YdaD
MGMGTLHTSRHDRSYRLLFNHPRMVEDLLRRFVAKAWLKQLDFSTLERANASFVSEGLHGREGDIAWRVRLRDSPVHLYVLVEFQSKVQRFMALRQSVYLGLFCQQLIDQGQLTPDRKLPPVLSVVVYNGKVDWWAPLELSELFHTQGGTPEDHLPRLRYRLLEMEAVRPGELRGRNLMALLIRLERARTHSRLTAIIPALVAALPGEDEGGLRRAFVVWLQRLLLPGRGEEGIPELVDLKEFRAMLIERVEEWSRKIEKKSRRQGLQEGLEKGLEQGLDKGQRELLLHQLETKFGPLGARTRARVQAARSESLLRWAERLLTAKTLTEVFGR